jgi:hypothetical protein
VERADLNAPALSVFKGRGPSRGLFFGELHPRKSAGSSPYDLARQCRTRFPIACHGQLDLLPNPAGPAGNQPTNIMKKFISLAILATSLAVSAQAVIVGFDTGYLVEGEDEYLSARVGHSFKTDDSLSHQVELEVGYTSDSEAGAKGSFTPVTINYRAESVAANKLGYYFGAGAGFARTKVRVPGSGVMWIRDDGTSFSAQAFVGLTYQASPSASLHLGAKYIWIDDVDLFGTNIDVGDDVVLSAGVSFRF